MRVLKLKSFRSSHHINQYYQSTTIESSKSLTGSPGTAGLVSRLRRREEVVARETGAEGELSQSSVLIFIINVSLNCPIVHCILSISVYVMSDRDHFVPEPYVIAKYRSQHKRVKLN